MPSYQYGDGCYGTQAAAAAAMAATEVGSVYSAGSRVWTVTGATVGASDVTFELTDLVSADPPITRTVATVFHDCSKLDWEDGLQLGWGIAAVWIVVAGIVFMTRGTKAPQ